MTTSLAERVLAVKPSPTLAMNARAQQLKAEGKDIIPLGAGEPDFDTPAHIKEATIAALQKGVTKYTAVEGTLSLRQAIVAKFARDNRLSYTPAEILVSCGCKHSLYNLFQALLNPNEEVIIPAPYWVSYPDMAYLASARPVIVAGNIENRFKITPAQLQSAITARTKLFVLNSPSNPTGIAYTAAELQALGEVLLAHPHVWVVCDDIYEHNYWAPEPFTTLLNVAPQLKDRTVIVNGMSKTYAMTGWRLGYAAGPLELIAAMANIQGQSTSNPTAFAQVGAEAALNGPQDCVATMTAAYKARHDYVVARINSIPGLATLASDGAFYSFVDARAAIAKHKLKDDIALCEWLLSEALVALIPGTPFGAPGFFRLSFAASQEKLAKGLDRIEAVLS